MWKIYYADVTPFCDLQLFTEKLKLIDAVRQKKVLSCKNESDKMRSLGAGLLLKQAQREAGLLTADGKTLKKPSQTGPYGKIIYDGVLDFNLSHSGDFAAAVVADCKVGIDVEERKSRFSSENGTRHMEQVMKRAFSEDEIGYVSAPEDDMEKKDRFIYIWTRKEAYAKAYGKGLAMDFKSIDTLQEKGFYSIRLREGCWLSAYSVGQQEQLPELVEEEICMMN